MSFEGGSTMMQTPLNLSVLMDRASQMQPDELIITKIDGGYHSITVRLRPLYGHASSSRTVTIAYQI